MDYSLEVVFSEEDFTTLTGEIIDSKCRLKSLILTIVAYTNLGYTHLWRSSLIYILTFINFVTTLRLFDIQPKCHSMVPVMQLKV